MKRALIIPLLWLSCSLPVFAKTITVDLNGGGDFTDIQSAIDAADDGDTVLVKPGEYVITEPINFNRLCGMWWKLCPNDVMVKNISVRSETGPAETIIRMAEEPVDRDQASVVVFWTGETDESILDGFTLTGGRGTNPQDWWHGGGVDCRRDSTPTIVNCTISGNYAQSGGGVSCVDTSSPTFINCVIAGNWAWNGGGVSCESDSLATFKNCTINGNWANLGGGLFCGLNSSLSLIGCTISGNSSRSSGGGLYCVTSSALPTSVTNCAIMGNVAQHGGGFYFGFGGSSPLTLTNCMITGNVALPDDEDRVFRDGEGKGGGVYCAGENSSLNMANCTISGNSAGTLKDNRFDDTDGEGGGVFYESGDLTLTNCILWGNGRTSLSVDGVLWSDIVDDIVDEALLPDIEFSSVEQDDVDDVWPGDGNINEDPLFAKNGVFDFTQFVARDFRSFNEHIEIQMPDFIVDPGDYRLQPESPCIDSGTLDSAPAIDIEANRRPCGDAVDMGAYELCPSPDTVFKRGDANADGEHNVTDVVFVLTHLFGGGEEPSCTKAADANDTGTVDLTDPVYLLNFLFAGGEQPAEPLGECGIDPTIDELTCESFAGCQ